MKKILAIVLCLAIALTSAIAMSVSAFAAAKPVVFDYTVSNDANTFYPDLGALKYQWGAADAGTSAYDASEEAWVLATNIALPQWATAYDHIWNGSYTGVVDWSTYKYMAVYYKTAGGADVHFAFMDDGAAQVVELPAQSSYGKQVFSTEGFTDAVDEVGYQILPGICNYAEADEPAGAKLAIKYIAFFETKAEADNFVLGETVPTTGENESGKTNTNTSDTAIISGAIVLCAAAATVVVFGRKRSK